VTLGKDSLLFGTTTSSGSDNGKVFMLMPPTAAGGTWTEAVLSSIDDHIYGRPYGRLLAWKGALYGTMAGNYRGTECGGTFTITPPSSPGKPWTELFFNFDTSITNICFEGLAPMGGIVADPSGNLFTAAWGGGPAEISGSVVYGSGTIVGPSGRIYAFTGGSDGSHPAGDLVALKGGMYGTTSGGGTGFGTVFWLAPPATPPYGNWTEGVLHAFAGGSDGAYPGSGLLAFQGAFFGTTIQGGTSNAGTVYVVKP
jgi:uncharacterized repeat protein (TIGR03803 family)